MKTGVKKPESWMKGAWGIAARPLIDRITEQITLDASGCWLWTGHISGSGYPMIAAGDTVYVHRWMHELVIGPIPEGWQVDHVRERGCTHRHCVNPAHLEAVTGLENILRSASPIALNVLKTHCPRGHDYALFARPKKSGARDCSICHRDRERAARRRRTRRAA